MDCDRTFVGTEDNVTNPEWPAATTRTRRCDFHIAVRTGLRILLNLTQVHLPCDQGRIILRLT